MNNKEIRSTDLSCWQRHFARKAREFLAVNLDSIQRTLPSARIRHLADTMQLFSQPAEFVQRRCSPKVSTCPSPDFFFFQFHTPLHSRIVFL